jgi:hypothetical protein
LISRSVFYDVIYFRNSQTPWTVRHDEQLLLARHRCELPDIEQIIETESLIREFGRKSRPGRSRYDAARPD